MHSLFTTSFILILVNIAKLYMYLSRTNQLLYTRLIKLIYFNREYFSWLMISAIDKLEESSLFSYIMPSV